MNPTMERSMALAGMKLKPVKVRPLKAMRIKGELSATQIPEETPFGEWTVKGPTHNWHTITKTNRKSMRPYALCECSCGVRREVDAYRLRGKSSKAQSCGKPACAKKARDKEL